MYCSYIFTQHHHSHTQIRFCSIKQKWDFNNSDTKLKGHLFKLPLPRPCKRDIFLPSSMFPGPPIPRERALCCLDKFDPRPLLGIPRIDIFKPRPLKRPPRDRLRPPRPRITDRLKRDFTLLLPSLCLRLLCKGQ